MNRPQIGPLNLRSGKIGLNMRFDAIDESLRFWGHLRWLTIQRLLESRSLLQHFQKGNWAQTVGVNLQVLLRP